MNKYEFNVKMFGNMTLEVMADTREEAEDMVKDVIENSSLKDIKLKEISKENMNINSSNVIYDIKDSKNKDMER